MILIILAGLFATLGAIMLINLAPPGTRPQVKSHARIPRPEPPKIEPAPSSDNPTPAPQASLAQPAARASDNTPVTDFAASTPAPGLVNEADVAALRAKGLLIPVAGVGAGQLRDSFYDGRSEGRTHEALDIMAAGGTPVLAAADGKIVRLFHSDRGGITLYELDSSGLYVYYYAHLQRYADGISDGKTLTRGEVIAYVGDTGNAGAGNYHLHFAISKPAAPGKWSGGVPINPYPILTGK
ncbi:MAG TPA: peptidoglycan DD-metalloendopeptidase family protein [Blastocatellia bacterium]|nr:peptidoglycan DD-metalloendopeptidase family protein [Blastocatellia bacterium]